jgi:hypothetical protein
MRRTTLLFLLATTATCYGQSSADIPADQPPIGSSYIDEDRPRIEQGTEETEPIEKGNEEAGSIKKRNEETERIEQTREETRRVEQSGEETGWVEQNSEEAELVQQNNAETEHLYRVRQDEEMEALRRQQQRENTFSTPVQHNLGRRYKQNERSSVLSTSHAGKSKPLYHTTPAQHKQSYDSSKKSYKQQSGGVHQDPKVNTNRN